LAPEDHASRVAAKGGDVVENPFDGGALVEEAEIQVVVVKSGGRGKSEDIDAIAWIVSGSLLRISWQALTLTRQR
jgi:hypothetical protein